MNNDKLAVFNETKLTILKLLNNCDDFLCGCDLIDKLDIQKNLLSYHIKTLEELGYIQENRCGRRKRYSIAPESADKVKRILDLIEII